MRRDGRGVCEMARAIGRSKSTVSREISERSAAADERGEPGHWEGDTVAGKAGAPAC